MSRVPQRSSKRLRIVPAAVGAGLAALLVVGCSAGQDTQTDSAASSANGAQGQVGDVVIRDARLAYPSVGAYPRGGVAPLILTVVNTGAGDDELLEVISAVAADVEVDGDRSLPARRALQVGTPGEDAVPTTSSSAAATTSTPISRVTVPPTGSATAPPSVPTLSTPASVPASSSASVSLTASVAPTGSVSARPTTSSAAPVQIGKVTVTLRGLTEPLQVGRTYSVTFVFRTAGSITLDLPIAATTSARPEPSEESHG